MHTNGEIFSPSGGLFYMQLLRKEVCRMGFHVCEYDENGKHYRFSNMSSGDVTLTFTSGRSWEMPDMILHYVADHHWLPPAEFIQDVMHGSLTGGERLQTKSINSVQRIGYLSGPFETGEVPQGFVDKLGLLMRQASEMGNRLQYRGGSL